MRLSLLTMLLLLPIITLATPHDRARQLIASGEKQDAWDLLYPLATQEQDPRAQIILGQLLLSSRNVPNHMEKALRMFRAADQNGHPAGRHFVNLTSEQIQFEAQAKKRVANSRMYYAQAEREYERLSKQLEKGFLDSDGKIYSARIDVFVTQATNLLSQVESLIKSNPKLEGSVLTTYHLVFDESKIGIANPFPSSFRPPEQGLEPDINGSLARELRVRDFPSIVLREAENRLPLALTIDQLQSWVNQWRPNPNVP